MTAAWRRAARWARWAPAALPALAWLVAAGAHAGPLEDWRAEAGRVRLLAENNVRQAYAEAQRLNQALPADATPADRARALNVLARAETYLGHTDAAARHAAEAFALAQAHGDRIGQAEADLNVSLNSINQGLLDQLVKTTQRSVVALEGTDRPELLAEAMLRLAVMYRRFEQLDDCVAVAVQTMEIARRSQNPLALAYGHQAMAMAFGQTPNDERSYEQYAAVRLQAQRVPARMIEAFAVAGMAGHVLKVGQPERAEQLAREALVIHREVGAPFAIAFGLYGLADVVAARGRRAEALALLDEAIAIFERHPNRIGQWFAFNARSTNHQALGDTARANADALRAYALARSLGHPIYLSGSAARMAAIAASAGDHKRAYELSTEASEMTARAVRDKSGARMLQLTQRYETESKQRAIDQLTRQTEQQQAQLRQRELQQRWLGTLLAAVALALAGAAWHMRRTRQAHRQLQALNEQLQHSENDVRALNAQLEQRVAERTAALRQQARYLRTLIDMLPMWAWFKDTRSRYLVTNRAHAEAHGQAVEQMVGRTDDELDAPAIARASMADDAEVMASGERKTVELAVEGGQWMEVYKAPVNDEDGTLLGTVGVARDISAHKAAEAAREAALGEAERLAGLRSEFLAQMSHELRTPLNGILGFADMLLADRGFNERQERCLRVIQHSGQHLLNLINDLLDMSRIDAGRLELHPSCVPLVDYLRSLADIVAVKAEQKGLAFEVELDRGLPAFVCADDMRLRQVLLNLVSNAVKFCDGGSVTLRVRCAGPAGTVALPGMSARLAFEVQDTGIGMEAQQLARLFRPFEQVADGPRRLGGAGLGLAISRQLVRLMGGDIQVESAPGRGSRFWFELELPVVDADGQAALEVAPAPAAGVEAWTDAAFTPTLAPPGPLGLGGTGAERPVPPLAELRELRLLARIGDMRQLQDRSLKLQFAEPRYAAFAAHVHALAQEFRSQALTAFIEFHAARAEGAASAEQAARDAGLGNVA